ncbi:putative polyketide synthase [Aaosphaeria arxii CBS 175.79]|uniref:Putative polyketide synthase n=1 Tax=Aaosphaeria arxii CBS 175.79 TaxID=1450172 RepID=A0A6A5Y343_9PLEO|nr:putative polyketide synthase [Aaosphaeria arxii CBS 175.79]KAF2019467.1 putative polyketide synthase [Aaosphaeria arxii CBS 175.79]
MSISMLPESLNHACKANGFVFGGHIGPQTKKTLAKEARQILDGANAKWILDALASMPQYWDAMVQKIPEMTGTMDGAKLLAHLESWLRLGDQSEDQIEPDQEIPDIWIGFMMIAIQLDQYWRYLEFRFDGEAGQPIDDLQAEVVKVAGSGKIETVGFCAGMIAAVAVASSHNRQEFERFGATALRIGVMMAALVGATEEWSKSKGKGGSVSLATAWRTTKQGADMARIVSTMSPDAYISVLFDDSRATITTQERIARKLVRQLRAVGVTAIPLAFKGKLHTPGEERARHTEALIEICRSMPELQFPDAANLALPTYLDHPEGKSVSCEETNLVDKVLRSILTSQLNWSSTVSKLAANSDNVSLIAFGLDRPMGPTIVRAMGQKQVQFEEIEEQIPKRARLSPTTSSAPKQTSAPEPKSPSVEAEDEPEDAIAIVGMSLKVAGADDLGEFEEMLKEGKSQHQVITKDRMTHDMLFREGADADPNRKWFGNFMRDADGFDHKFFKRSPREAMAIDPQGRLSMHGAYQAVEQSGYFNEMSTITAAEQERRKQVGCYVGLCSFEYEINTICHPATAFTGTGSLRSFISGRMSHYFGWTGPALTVDTACSSSTVALHTACRDLINGEVRAALCGGVNVLTNLQWTQNLNAGGFISSSGQCKPFDADADGYCRGDGIAYVFLKKLSTAKADGNMILGTIRATGINQNLNSTPLFVPNVPSLSTLFKDVIKKAQVQPREISLVECHGTGTPVGDPAEYESVRLAVGGDLRDDVVPIGSVKGHVGHTEGAAGLISLIKVLTMMREGFIPAQASFNKMNPHIHAQPSDKMEVVTTPRPWKGDRKYALINNYGACGSNASLVLSHTACKPSISPVSAPSAPRLPFWISGLDHRSIAAYSRVLAPYLSSRAGPEEGQATLADVSFNMKRQSNPNLPQAMIFSCNSLAELQDKLSGASDSMGVGLAPTKPERPVVLCFGGQVSTFVGLDPTLYHGVTVLRRYIDECNDAITSQGLDSILPDIFSCQPVQDVVKLQLCLFAMQYASAKTWLDCGLAEKVVAVVGHSFGEITELCVSGVLSLEDTVKLIAGRAKLVKNCWGSDSGAMMAVEADEEVVHDLLKDANLSSDGSASIACYNGPRSFTLAGSTEAIEEVAKILEDGSKFQGVRSKRLNVTNAFHSSLVQPLVADLGEIGKTLTFNDPVIPIESATEHEVGAPLDWSFVGSHMRQPVFFNHAVQRLVKKYPQAIFLEAGSNSTITIMASRALAAAGLTTPESHHFQSVSITNTTKGMDGLTDATVSLWKQGLRVNFWAHHTTQTDNYAQLLLPPYQFERSRHWLEVKSPLEQAKKIAQKMIEDGAVVAKSTQMAPDAQEGLKSLGPWTFMGFQNGGSEKKPTKLARFRINTTSAKYQSLFATHVIAQTAPICPATLEIDMAIETLYSLNQDWKANGFSPIVRDMLSHSPICADSTRTFYLDLEPVNKAETEWRFMIHSVSNSSSGHPDKHAEGRITMSSPSAPAFTREFSRYERVVNYAQCESVLNLGPGDEGVDALQGRNVYRAFKEVCDFGPVYEGVKYVVGRDGESAGIVRKRHTGDTWLDVPKADSFGQVAGMYVNLLTDLPASDMFVATGLEMVMRSPKIQTVTDGKEHGSGVWHVLARHQRENEKSFTTDVFIFDAETRTLAEVILGLRYVRIAKATMSKILARTTADKSFVRGTAPSFPPSAPQIRQEAANSPMPREVRPRIMEKSENKQPKSVGGAYDITDDVRNIVANVSGIDVSEFKLDSELADLGIDSLMGMELAREIENTFKCTLDQNEQMKATSIRQFVDCVKSAVAQTQSVPNGQQQDSDEDDDESSINDNVFTDQSDDASSVISFSDSVSHGSIKSAVEAAAKTNTVLRKTDVAARAAEAVRLTNLYTAGWESPGLKAAEHRTASNRPSSNVGPAVIVTGASGSLGAHLVQALAEREDVSHVVCMNRPVSNVAARKRQLDALTTRGIELSPTALAKLRVYDTDTSKPQLGLPAQEFTWLVEHGTHLIHNAWPMSAIRPLRAFEPQIKTMRNLLDLARDMAISAAPRKIGFQYVSSIGVVGFSGERVDVPEQFVPMDSVIPSGYNEGKWVCERMLDETMRRHPRLFRASACRPGQISGSTKSGVWNPVEHFPFILKSAQALKSWPDLPGTLHWLPVNKSAAVMVDLLKLDCYADISEPDAHPVYHIDNPVGQPWNKMSSILAPALSISPENIVPFEEWVRRVRESNLPDSENPAARAIAFLEQHFRRMATGGIVLDTTMVSQHSPTMAAEGPVPDVVVMSYIKAWKEMGFLQ